MKQNNILDLTNKNWMAEKRWNKVLILLIFIYKSKTFASSKSLIAASAQTDVKRNRIKRPADQEDQDMYVHVVDKRNAG